MAIGLLILRKKLQVPNDISISISLQVLKHVLRISFTHNWVLLLCIVLSETLFTLH